MSLNKSKVLRTAEKYVLQGKIPAAIDEYRKVVSADPGDLTTINTLGDLYVRAGRVNVRTNRRISEAHASGSSTTHAWPSLGSTTSRDVEIAAWSAAPLVIGERASASPCSTSVGTSTVGSTGRRSVSAPMWPAARTVAGRRFCRIIVARAASRSAGMRSENRPG